MRIRCGKVKHWTLHLQREFGRWSSLSCQSYSTTGRSIAHLSNSATKAKIHLVGVNHVSPKSVEHVRRVVRHEKPDVIAVELCKKRAVDILSHGKMKMPEWRDFFSVKGSFKERIFKYASTYLYAYFTNADDGELAGAEMRVAIEEGLAIGATVLFMDADIDVTVSNVSKQFSIWKVIKFYFKNQETFKESYPKLNGALLRISDAFDKHSKEELSMREFRNQFDTFFEPGVIEEAITAGDKYFPEVMRALVHERNEHMVQRLRKMKGNVVAVVGAAHVPGICHLWQDAEVPVEEK